MEAEVEKGDSDALEGQVVGNYRILSQLGEGGMGAVYLAHHELIDKKVVIKVLHPQMAARTEFVERFHREAKAATAIGHEHIVDVTDMGRFPDGSPFIVMEHLEGSSLADLLAEHGRLPIARSVRLVRQLCDALAAAHDKGIVHRDMKPDNVFVLQRRGRDFVKVLDFGISKFLAEEQQNKLTQTGVAMGTPAYMSPEQTQGLESVDHRTDLYAVGVILHELLAGELPFSAATFAALILKSVTEPPPPLRTVRPDVPEGLERAVLQALAKRPEHRPVDLRAFSRQLAPYEVASRLDADAIGALPTDPPPRDESGMRRANRAEAVTKPNVAGDGLEAAGSATAPLGELPTDPPPPDASTEAPEQTGNQEASAAPRARPWTPTRTGEDILAELPTERPPPGPPEASVLEAPPAVAPPAVAPSEAPQGPQARRPWGVAVAMGVAAAGAVALGGVAWTMREAPPETAERPATPREVHVRIRVAPADATIEIDGVQFDNPLEAQRLRSLSPVRLRVERDGYEPLERMVVFDQDRAYDLQLAPAVVPSLSVDTEPGLDAGPADVVRSEGRPTGARRPLRRRGRPSGETGSGTTGHQGIYEGRRSGLRDEF